VYDLPLPEETAVLAPLLAAMLASGASTETTLDNGLRVVLIPHRANPMVASAVVVGAGVVHEPAGAGGASHFLEHLLFDGTSTRSQREIAESADRIGAYNNATTREDHTLFTLLVASRYAEAGLELQADMLFRSTIPADVFESERKIVLEELARDRSDPGYARRGAMREAVYAGTPIDRPVLGTEASLGSLSRETVLAYYRARYVPGNMVLVVMGDFEAGPMLDAVRRTFGGARKGKLPPASRASWPDPTRDNVESADMRSPPGQEVGAAFPFDADPWDRTSYAAELLLEAASVGEDAPLAAALAARGIDGPAQLTLVRRARPFSTVEFEAPPDAGSAAGALDALAEAVRSTRPGGAARARLDVVLARARAEAAIARDQIHYFALLRGDRILGAPPGASAGEADLLRSLGSPDWDAASERLERGLARLRAHVASEGLAAARTAWRPPAATPVAPDAAPVLTGTLDNGLRYLARRSADSEVVALHVAFAPRGAAEPAGLDGVTDLLHRAMLRATLVHPAPSLERRLDALGARLKAVDDPSVPFDDYYTTPEFSWIRLEVGSDTWREAVALVGEMVTFPDLGDDALERARAEMIPLAERRAASPRETAVARLDALLAPGSPWVRPPGGTPDSLRRITRQALEERHRTLASGRRTIVTLVGPVAAEAAVSAIHEAFSRLPAGEAAVPAKVKATTAPPGADEAALGAAQGYLAMGAVLEVPEAERAALTIAVAALSDRLSAELREKRGLAYSVGASLRPWGEAFRLDIGMGTRADNLAAAEAGVREVLRTLRALPPDAEEVARVVRAVRGRALMRRMTRISLAYESGMELLRGREPGDERRAVEALDGVESGAVGDVIERRIDPERLARVVVR
jgi:zinc protease